jgi:putative peptidoglycan lipid II flippase
LLFVALLAPGYLEAVGSRVGATSRASHEVVAALVAMAIGTLIGGALQFLVQLPALRRVGFRYRAIAAFATGVVSDATHGPRRSIAAVRSTSSSTYFASELGDGPYLG